MRAEILWCIPVGIAVGFLCVPLFNRIPAAWLCDYGETPAPELLKRRVSAVPAGLLLAAVFGILFPLLAAEYGISAVFFLLAAATVPLVLAAVSDIRYQILPDESLPAVLIPALTVYLLGLAGKTQYYGSVASPFLGALFGGGVWLLIGLLGRALYHRDSIGFGDVKLFAAIGFLCGFPGVVSAFLTAILLAGVSFLILILLRRIAPDQYVPMGPYLCAGCLLQIAFAKQIAAFAAWYFSIL